MEEERTAIFISHATPDDNPFVIWLGAKLAQLGYDVWADIFKLFGGDDWERKLEDALRNRACKFLLVANPISVGKQGVRNEVTIATDVSKKIGDTEFIIPLRLAPYDSPFLIVQAQYVDFKDSWTAGLNALIKTLDEKGVPRSKESKTELWKNLQLIHQQRTVVGKETLISNWLILQKLPENLAFYDFNAGISIGRSTVAMNSSPLPVVKHNRGFISFCRMDELQSHFGPALPLTLVHLIPTQKAISEGWRDMEIWRSETQKLVVNLLRQTIESHFKHLELTGTEFSSQRLGWWPSGTSSPTEYVHFKWGDLVGKRKLQGASVKRGFRWHFAISVYPRTYPCLHVRVQSRVIFTEDGITPYEPQRMSRLRKSFTKGWRNAKWRDLMLAYLSWLANGKNELRIPVGDYDYFLLGLPPMLLEAGVIILEGSNVSSTPLPESDETDDEIADEEAEFFDDEQLAED